MKWYHWVILSMKDKQGAGNVFHTVTEITMSQRFRVIPSLTPILLDFQGNYNNEYVLRVINCSSDLENTII